MNKQSEQARLKVAHMMPWAGIGGVEIATLRMVDATLDRVDPVAFCMSDARVIPSFVERAVPIVRYTPPQPSFRHPIRFYRESRELASSLRDAKVQIVHFAEIKAAYHCGLAALLAGVKRISHVRNVFPYIPWQERLILRTVQSFLFVSEQARQYSAIPTSRRRTQVIYDAVVVPPELDQNAVSNVRRQFDIPDNVAIIGMVARVNPQKDYVTLARAAAIVLQVHPLARFLIVGDNSMVDINRDHHAEILRLLQELGIQQSFIFAGHQANVNPLIQAMSFCVLPTHREGFPLSILETMAQRKAVIATDVGGIPEIIRNGENGFLVPHQDANALADRILFLLQHPEEALRLGQQAANLVLRDYSPEKFAAEVVGAYRDVLQQGSKSTA